MVLDWWLIRKALANNVSKLDDLEKLTVPELTSDARTKDSNPPSIHIINIPTSLSGGE